MRLAEPADVRNAFNAGVIAELTECFAQLGAGAGIRAVMLGGRGSVFCAGADLEWMHGAAKMSEEENYADALRLAGMLAAVDACPVPVVCRVQRAAMGGALGLMACCDTVICTSDCRFAFGEVRLGISPATIAPYIVNRIGAGDARDLFLSGERFTPERAFAIGLVHAVVEPDELDDVVEAKLSELLMAGPEAARASKALLRSMARNVTPELHEQTARLIAQLRVSAEGQEGLEAFLQKRPPAWQED